MLLSTPQPIILTVHIILLFYSATPAHVVQLEEHTCKGPGSSPGPVNVISGNIVFGLNTIFAQKIICDVSCHKAIIIFKITVFENATNFFPDLDLNPGSTSCATMSEGCTDE